MSLSEKKGMMWADLMMQGTLIRGIIMNGFLYITNYKPDRWPAGNPETGYLNCDGSPTKHSYLNMQRQGVSAEYWKMSFGMRSLKNCMISEKILNV